MDNSRNVTEDREQDIYKEVCIAAALEEDTDWWEDDREDDLDDVGTGERHFGCSVNVLRRAVDS